MKKPTHLFLRFVTTSFLLLAFPLNGEEEIRVELNTRAHLAPLYLGAIHEENSTLKDSYLNKLHQILAFDLKHCGFAKLSEKSELMEKTLAPADPQVVFQQTRFEKTDLSYILKGVVHEHKLQLYAFHVKSSTLKSFDGIPLTGDLNRDRQQIHKLSDALVKDLFGAEGIASTYILYSAESEAHEKEWKAEIWQCDWDGARPKQVTFEKSYCITPFIIPADRRHGGGRFLYVNYKNGQPKVYFSSLKTRTGKPLLTLRGNQLLPAVSSQKDQIAFICDAAGRADLFVQAVENGVPTGKPMQLFSYPRATQGSPTFSPDGKKIAFVSDKDGTPRIYLIPSKQQGSKRATPLLLTKRNRENTCPVWSPDGTKLAYSAKTNGIRQIWIYDFVAEEEQQLTSGPGNKENPCWAPNGLHLIFNSTGPDGSDLFLVNLNQSDVTQITNGPGRKHYPSWGNQ